MRSLRNASFGVKSHVQFKLALYEAYNQALMRLIVQNRGMVVGCSDSPAVALAVSRIADLRPQIPQDLRVRSMRSLALPDGWPLAQPQTPSCEVLFFDLS